MQEFELDILKNQVEGTVLAKQGDVGRKIKVEIKVGVNPYTIPQGARFSVWYSGASGEGNYSAIGNESAFVVEGNTVTVELIAQMLTNAGNGMLCLVMNGADGSQLGLGNLVYTVESVPGMGSTAANQYYTALSELAGKVIHAADTFETDTSLVLAGKAADAASVGSALNGKAPAGYGLGGYAKTLYAYDDLNAVISTGWYAWGGSLPANVPNGLAGCVMEVIARGDTDVVQRVIYQNNAQMSVLMRLFNDTWGEWEWENPPMMPGVEYRTTERYNGKPVYVKAINFGALPNASSKVVAWGSGVEKPISYSAVDSGNNILPYRYYHPTTGAFVESIDLNVDSNNISIHTDNDKSNKTAIVAIKYTKD